RPGAGSTRANTIRDVNERRLARVGFRQRQDGRRNARASNRNLDLCRESLRALRFGLLSLLWLRPVLGLGLGRRFWSWLRASSPPRTLIRVLRRPVVRPVLLFVCSDHYHSVSNCDVHEWPGHVVPVLGVRSLLIKFLVAQQRRARQCSVGNGLRFIPRFSR